MDKMTFKTLVKYDHKHGHNEYILGRLSGIQWAVCECDDRLAQAIKANVEGRILTVECTMKQYDKFVAIVDRWYPKLCVFNYVEEKKLS